MNKVIYRTLLTIIIILGFFLRLGYVIKMPYTQGQHDTSPTGCGAINYMKVIYEEGRLPDSNVNQYYHPPLHHIIGAGWMSMVKTIHSLAPDEYIYESLQYLTLIYSMIIVIISYRIFNHFKLSRKIKLILIGLISFHPALIILSGSLNNDELCFLMFLWSILNLIRWYKKDNILNTIFLAITTGLCVMSKISGAIIALPIMYIFIFKFYKEMKKSKNKKKTFIKYLCTYTIFGLISLPIGLWFAIRNYMLFDQKILYVPRPTEKLYVGDYNLWQRLTPFSSDINKIYCDPWTDYNMTIYLLKCSLFGEFAWGEVESIQVNYYIALFTNALLIIITLYSMIKGLFSRNKRNKQWKITMTVLAVFNFISYVVTNLKLPYGCTMDFRYMYPALFAGISFIGFELSNMEKKNKLLSNSLYGIVCVLSIMLVITSNIVIFSWNAK